jgi:energy-coupling factor transporter transmembrane protein EcfT
MKLKVLQFVVVVLLALALMPVGAHLLALPNKIDLPEGEYFTTQAIYLGWALPTGTVLISAIVSSLVLVIVVRGQGAVFWLALASFALITATLVIFFNWTQPANQATDNWTVVPDNWRALRAQWEYSHAVNAVLTFLAFCAAVASTLTRRRDRAAAATREA